MTALLLLAGIALGPLGLQILTPDRVALLDPLVSLAVVTLGVLAVLRRDAAAVEAGLVCGGAVLLALLRFHDLDLGPLAWQAAREAEALAAAAALAAAGFLLIRDAASATERRVFLLGIVLALSGAADFTQVPALPLGILAGLTWRAAPRLPEAVSLELVPISQPLTAVLVFVVGVEFQPTLDALIVGIVCGAGLVVASRRSGLRRPPGPMLAACALDIGHHLAPSLAPVISGAALAMLVAHVVLDRARATPSTGPAQVCA